MDASVAVLKNRPSLSTADYEFLAGKTGKGYEYKWFNKVKQPVLPQMYTRKDASGEETRTFGENSCEGKYGDGTPKAKDLKAQCKQQCGTIDTPLAADRCTDNVATDPMKALKAICEDQHPEYDPACLGGSEGCTADTDRGVKVEACVQELKKYLPGAEK